MHNITVEHFDTRIAKIVALISRLLLTLHGCASVASVATFCTVEIPKAGAPPAGRSFSMVMRDGREITVIGQNHGDSRQVVQLARIAEDTTTPNDTFLKKSESDVRSLQDTLTGFREEAAFLRNRAQAGKLDFVALEWGPVLASLMSERLPVVLEISKQNFANRGLKSSRIRDDAFLVLAAPAKYLELTEPTILCGTKIIGIENDERMSESVEGFTRQALPNSK